VKGERITNWVEIQGYSTEPKARLLFERDDPRASDTGRRCSPGYVTISLEGGDSGVFMISEIRRALDEYERRGDLA
jgi:hypothetical protein